jgi:branched-subunit amino acid transport protein
MRVELVLLFLVVGAGVYATRLLPLLAALRRERTNGEGPAKESSEGALRRLLGYVGPSVIAALLVSSLLSQWEASDLRVIAIALALTGLVAFWLKNLGLTVLVGVLAYWLASLLL